METEYITVEKRYIENYANTLAKTIEDMDKDPKIARSRIKVVARGLQTISERDTVRGINSIKAKHRYCARMNKKEDLSEEEKLKNQAVMNNIDWILGKASRPEPADNAE